MARFEIKGLCPTTNNAFKVGRGRFYESQEYKDWKSYALLSVPRNIKLRTDSLYVHVTFFITRDCDIDGRIKGTLDAFNGRVWKDDMQIQELHINKVFTSKKRQRTLISVSGSTKFRETEQTQLLDYKTDYK